MGKQWAAPAGTRAVLAGIAVVSLAVPGSGLAAASTHPTANAPIATAGMVTRAFAARGIRLEQKALLMAARGSSGLPKLFWNRGAASTQGVITVRVLRTAADAKGFPMRTSSTSDCAGFPAMYLTLRSRNVVATYTDCFNLSSSVHLATRPVLPVLIAVMHGLAG